MDVLDTLYRYITGANDGLVGKLQQHQDTFIPDERFIPEDDVLSFELLEKLEKEPKFLTRGSIAYIYTSKYNKKKITIKAVSKHMKETIIPKQQSLLDKMTYIKYLNSSLVEPIMDVKKGLLLETSMKNEYDNYKKLTNSNPEKNGISLVECIEELCTEDVFVYTYIKAKPLTTILKMEQTKINEILSRIIRWVIESTYNGIMIPDINVGNFLYNVENDIIYAIDYGSIIESPELVEKCYEIYYNCKTPTGIQYLVDTYCGGSTDAVQQFETYKTIVHDKTITSNMAQTTKNISSMLCDLGSVMKINGFEHIVSILRSQHLLISLIDKFNVNTYLGDDFCVF